MNTRRLIKSAAAALLAATISVQAQVPATPPPVPGQTPVPAPSVVVENAPAAPAAELVIKDADAAHGGTATKKKDSSGRDTLSVDFPEEDVRNIVRNVADLFELNIIIPETLQGKASIKLRDVSWRQIFQSVLSPINFTYIEEGNIIKIVSNDSLQIEPVTTDVFIINYARASDLLPTLTTLVDATLGRIVVDARSNSLVITERPTRMNRIRPIIEQLDRATDQVMIETKFVEVTDRDVRNIGVNWSSLSGYSIGAGPLTGDFTRTRGQTGSSDSTGKIGTTAESENRRIVGTTAGNTITGTSGQQSASTTTGTVTSTNGTPTSSSSTGSTGGLTNSTTNTTTSGVTNAVTNTALVGSTNAFNLLQSLANTDATARTLSTVFSADEFRLVLSALQTQNSIKLVSNPTIVTLNNTQATILIGQKYPIATPNITGGAAGSNLVTYTITEKDIGIKLEVTPQVNARGFIKLTVKPTVSSISGTVTIPQGAEYPIVATREATTQISLKDGYTMGIGGLIQDTTSKGETKVPILGSIPVLGRLFRSDTKNRESSNLIIFITAKTVSAEGAPVEALFNSDQVRGLEMRREDLPGYRDGSDPFLKPADPKDAKKSPSKK